LKQRHKKKILASAFSVRRTTQEEKELYQDACWALADPEVRAKHEGRLVVPYRRRIVASGLDPKAVREEAARVTGTKIGELPLISIVHPLEDISPDGFGTRTNTSE
jgi:hypothetical protein